MSLVVFNQVWDFQTFCINKYFVLKHQVQNFNCIITVYRSAYIEIPPIPEAYKAVYKKVNRAFVYVILNEIHSLFTLYKLN